MYHYLNDPGINKKYVSVTIGAQKYKTEIQAKNQIIIADEPVEVGGQDLGFTPAELLEASLATCSVMAIRMYADRKEWNLQEAKVNVSFKRNIKTHLVAFKKEIEIIGDLTEEQRSR
ncbi:Putative redox protein, regulator of disulfide bond formation [Croceitalea dokdonensis DOKDO 023]|uniref:Putative redox protein, regulator of disulfide bond formation n=1 Tax=Croceitalea dokdonensis DOKDO 023 TaxID=1300341 RepID=A0A0P7ATM2_9FLAO|nr:OsmC family protein [Croceitalea dokdonensis]KPM31233.1 Putative redox protein, regulator of disulfide bond formation [Croceitalea dokdonensis DOKDO 023]